MKSLPALQLDCILIKDKNCVLLKLYIYQSHGLYPVSMEIEEEKLENFCEKKKRKGTSKAMPVERR